MLGYLSGKVIARFDNVIIVKLPAGMGYSVTVSPKKKYLQNENVELYILEVYKDNGVDLYGFEDYDEKEWSEKMMKVGGVGPRSAVNIVFTLGIPRIAQALQIGDPKPFAEVRGLGAKTAKKIILELKGEISDSDQIEGKNISNSYFTQEFVETFGSLGYKRSEIVSVISKLKKAELWNENDIVETVRHGLKALGRG